MNSKALMPPIKIDKLCRQRISKCGTIVYKCQSRIKIGKIRRIHIIEIKRACYIYIYIYGNINLHCNAAYIWKCRPYQWIHLNMLIDNTLIYWHHSWDMSRSSVHLYKEEWSLTSNCFSRHETIPLCHMHQT